MKAQAVFFDATGTLIQVRRSVGSVYAEIGRRWGLGHNAGSDWPQLLERAFGSSLRGAEPLAFPSVSASELAKLERSWWRRRVRETFSACGEVDEGDFEEFFDAVFRHFAQPAAWRRAKGCSETLEPLKRAGFPLVVVSNFDSRLPQLLRGLGLDGYFDVVVYSSRAGAAKPNPKIFLQALEETGLSAGAVLHVGDDAEMDYWGARSAGLQAVLFDPSGEYAATDGIHRIGCLTDVPGFLL